MNTQHSRILRMVYQVQSRENRAQLGGSISSLTSVQTMKCLGARLRAPLSSFGTKTSRSLGPLNTQRTHLLSPLPMPFFKPCRYHHLRPKPWAKRGVQPTHRTLPRFRPSSSPSPFGSCRRCSTPGPGLRFVYPLTKSLLLTHHQCYRASPFQLFFEPLKQPCFGFPSTRYADFAQPFWLSSEAGFCKRTLWPTRPKLRAIPRGLWRVNSGCCDWTRGACCKAQSVHGNPSSIPRKMENKTWLVGSLT